MVLGRKDGVFPVPEALQGVIVQVDVRYFNIFALQGKSVVLRCYFDPAC